MRDIFIVEKELDIFQQRNKNVDSHWCRISAIASLWVLCHLVTLVKPKIKPQFWHIISRAF